MNGPLTWGGPIRALAFSTSQPIPKEMIMRVDHRETDLENNDRGLDYDLPRVLRRRGMLKLVAGAGLAGAGLITLGACAADGRRPRGHAGLDGSPSGAPTAGRAGVRPEADRGER